MVYVIFWIALKLNSLLWQCNPMKHEALEQQVLRMQLICCSGPTHIHDRLTNCTQNTLKKTLSLSPTAPQQGSVWSGMPSTWIRTKESFCICRVLFLISQETIIHLFYTIYSAVKSLVSFIFYFHWVKSSCNHLKWFWVILLQVLWKSLSLFLLSWFCTHFLPHTCHCLLSHWTNPWII